MTQTVLHSRLTASGAKLGSYCGAETAATFGDVAAELQALRSGTGVFDLGWRAKIIVTGTDRVRWLNGMVTNNIKDLAADHGNYNFLLNAQGRILADMQIYNRGDYLLLDTDYSQLETVMKALQHFIIMDDVELSDSSNDLTALGVCGPGAAALLTAAGIDPAGLAPLELRNHVVGGFGISVVRGPMQKPDWYEVWVASVRVVALWDLLLKAGAQPVGSDALELWRILHGIPRYGQDIRERDLPQETQQTQALNFTKGCYIGQEIVERIRSRGAVHRHFTGFEFSGQLPHPGKYEDQGRTVAEITSVAAIPSNGAQKNVGLGYVRDEAVSKKPEINLNGTTARIVQPPFVI